MIARLKDIFRRSKKVWFRFERTLIWRSWTRFSDLRGNRLAGAVTFYGFISLFPVIVIAAAVMSAAFGQDGVETVQDLINENLPGFGTAGGEGSAALDVQRFYQNSGTIGLIGVVTLLFTGGAWVDATRAAVRSMWRLDDKPGNVVVRRLIDLIAMVGLGVLILVSSASSALLSGFTQTLLDLVGIEGVPSRWALQAVTFLLAVGVSSLLIAYLLTGLPRIWVPHGELVVVALVGGVAFEILKQFLIGFVAGPASRNAYAAFATPLALLAWIYLITRVLMLLAAVMAQIADDIEEDETAAAEAAAVAEAEAAQSSAPPPWPAVVSARRARAVGFAAGGVLGLITMGATSATRRAGRALVDSVRGHNES